MDGSRGRQGDVDNDGSSHVPPDMPSCSDEIKRVTSNPDKSTQRKKRVKQRSKRNRKRPRSQSSSNDSQVYETYTRRLELDGKPLTDPCCWIRLVEPYPFTFSTFAKARWIGRSILDVYHTEFGSYPRSYYENAISQGRILVSDQKVDPSYQIKSSDLLSHTVHRHEPAVAVSLSGGTLVNILQETDTLVVVDKPGTLPVHPCGGYHVNSLLNILKPRYGKLFTINRLDRLTSGVVILAKTSSVAQDLGRCIMERDSCQKIYLARVRGKFPLACRSDLCLMTESSSNPPCRYGEWVQSAESQMRGNAKRTSSRSADLRRNHGLGFWITDTSGTVQHNTTLLQVFESRAGVQEWLHAVDNPAECQSNGMRWFHLACPTRVASPKDGICEAGSFDELDDTAYGKTVKPCETAFGVVEYDADTDSTIVLCRPETGRTHQIRLHLQFLGHSIANDPNYGGSLWFGDPQGEEACRIARAKLDAMDGATQEAVDQLKGVTGNDNGCNTGPVVDASVPEVSTTTDTPATEEEIRVATLQPRAEDETLDSYIKKTCVWCARSKGGGNERVMLEFLVRSKGIWLHALKYTMLDAHGEKRSFETDLPHWARLE